MEVSTLGQYIGVLCESVMDMYDGARTAMRSPAGLTEEFEVDVGLHQGFCS